MIRHRVRIVLLSLGVLIGFGSAFAHFAHGRGHHAGRSGHDDWGWRGPCGSYDDRTTAEKPAAP